MSESDFQVGDAVRIITDKTALISLQEDYGGWIDSLETAIGKQGVVKRIFPNGAVRVQVLTAAPIFNPKALRKVRFRNFQVFETKTHFYFYLEYENLVHVKASLLLVCEQGPAPPGVPGVSGHPLPQLLSNIFLYILPIGTPTTNKFSLRTPTAFVTWRRLW